MILRRGEVVLIRVPFHQTGGSKVRPAMVALEAGDDDLVVIPITSQARFSEFDIALPEWKKAGLNVPSTARIHKMASISKAAVAEPGRCYGHGPKFDL